MNGQISYNNQKPFIPNLKPVIQNSSYGSGPPTPLSQSSVSPPTIKITVETQKDFVKKTQFSNTQDTSIDSGIRKQAYGVMGKLKQMGNDTGFRKDRTGKIIIRGSKKHHISFRDSITGGEICDVQEVESYKDYNLLVDDKTSTCSCVLL